MQRREFLKLGGQLAAASSLLPAALATARPAAAEGTSVFDVTTFGAVGDGTTLDSAAFQKAIDAAAATGQGARVLVPAGRRYLVGTLELRSGIDFHLAGDAELRVSTDPAHYRDAGLLIANGAKNLRISGTGNIDGRAREFMTGYDPANEWWLPKPFRPRLFILTDCNDLEVRDLSFSEAPSWGLHMLGCERVLVDNLRIRNLLDVPNCDGIDPDHCRDVEIRNCHIVCGDDAIVIKATRTATDHGPSTRIVVRDCVIETQDSGLKIGTETVSDIHGIRFERCKIVTSCRGLTIQLRDEGNVYDVEFNDIEFVARYHSDPWWGRGEAISFTAIPRTAATKVGKIRDIRVRNVTGRAENSVRVQGSAGSRVKRVTFENVAITLDRWTNYRGALFDNRPTSAQPAIEPHHTPAFSLRHADGVVLKNCRVAWGKNCPDTFTHAIEAEDVTGLELTHFSGESAHPSRFDAIVRG